MKKNIIIRLVFLCLGILLSQFSLVLAMIVFTENNDITFAVGLATLLAFVIVTTICFYLAITFNHIDKGE